MAEENFSFKVKFKENFDDFFPYFLSQNSEFNWEIFAYTEIVFL
jgi:hypothetical protein